jgi:hypothetical protein
VEGVRCVVAIESARIPFRYILFPLHPSLYRKRPIKESRVTLSKWNEPILLSCVSFSVSLERMWICTPQEQRALAVYTTVLIIRWWGAKPISVSDVSLPVMFAAASSCLVASSTRQLYDLWRVFGWWAVLISNRTPKPWHRCLSFPLSPSETGILR